MASRSEPTSDAVLATSETRSRRVLASRASIRRKHVNGCPVSDRRARQPRDPRGSRPAEPPSPRGKRDGTHGRNNVEVSLVVGLVLLLVVVAFVAFGPMQQDIGRTYNCSVGPVDVPNCRGNGNPALQ